MANFGLYADLMAWGLILSSIITLGLPAACTKLVAEKKVNAPSTNGSLIVIILVITIIQFGLVFVFNLIISNIFVMFFYFQPFVEILFILVGIRLLFQGPVMVNQGIFTGFKEIKQLSLIMAIGYIAKIPILISSVIFWNITGAFFAEIILHLIFFSLFVWFLLRIYRKEGLSFNWKEAKSQIRPLYSLSLPIFLTVISSLVVNWVGFRVLGFFYTEASIGIFQIAINVVTLAFIIPTAIVAPFLPQITEEFQKNPEKFRNSIVIISKFAALIIFPTLAALGFLSPVIISLFYPQFYLLETFQTVFILVTQAFLSSLIIIFLQVLIATTSLSKIILLDLIKSLVQLLLTLILVPLFGLIGLGTAFLTAFVIQYFAFFIYFRKRFKITLIFPTLLGAITGIMFFPYLFFFNISYGLIIGIYIGIPLTVVAGMASLFLLWQDKNCRQYLKNLLRIFSRGGNEN